jgi:hypothetical protein
MNATNHTIGETIDWNPAPQFYIQGNLNLVYNVIGTDLSDGRRHTRHGDGRRLRHQ